MEGEEAPAEEGIRESYQTDQLLRLQPRQNSTPIDRISLFARALAHGALQGYWSTEMGMDWKDRNGDGADYPITVYRI